MKKFALLAALLLSQAQALEVRVFEPSLERVIGYGRLEGSTLRMWLLREAQGPAVIFFVDDDKNVESYKATVERNVVSFFRSSGGGGGVSLRTFADNRDWNYSQILVNGPVLTVPTSNDSNAPANKKK